MNRQSVAVASIVASVCALFIVIGGMGCAEKSDKGTGPDEQVNLADDTALGKLVFSLDSSLQKSATLDTSDVSISVTDEQGVTWQLTIPGNALYHSTRVTMTPIQTVESSPTLWPVTCGVVFGPNEFVFAEPAKLTVTIPQDVPDTYAFYLMNDDGSQLSFSDFQKTGERTYEVVVNHFSGVGGGESSALEERGAAAMTQYNNALAAIQSFVQGDISAPAVPPDLSNLCKDKGKGDAQVSSYVKTFFEPEGQYVASLTSCWRQIQSCGVTSHDEEARSAVCNILTRQHEKVLTLIDTYISNEKKYQAISYAAIAATAQQSLMSCDNGARQTEVLAKLADYAKNCRDSWYDKIVNEHDLEGKYPAFEFNREFHVLGGLDDEFVNKLARAMTFTLTVEFYNKIGPDADVEMQGEGTIDLKLEAIEGSIGGSGEITYSKGALATNCGSTGQTDCPSVLTSPSFNVNVILEYDPCESPDSIKVISPLTYSAVEIWDMCDGALCEHENQEYAAEKSYTHSLTVNQFTAPPTVFWEGGETNLYTFRLPIDKAATLVDKQYNKNFVAYITNFHIVLKHTPQS